VGDAAKLGDGNAVSLSQNVLIVGTQHCRFPTTKFGQGNAVSLPQKSYRRDLGQAVS
jgi:hypothetical protein